METRTYKVLVVDDEVDVCEVMARSLPRRLNVEVAVCSDGAAVAEKARTFKPDLVLLDIHLPGHMGWDVLRDIRAFDPGVKIVIVTAIFAVPREDEELILKETSGYLTKPVELDDICDKIVTLFGDSVIRR